MPPNEILPDEVLPDEMRLTPMKRGSPLYSPKYIPTILATVFLSSFPLPSSLFLLPSCLFSSLSFPLYPAFPSTHIPSSYYLAPIQFGIPHHLHDPSILV